MVVSTAKCSPRYLVIKVNNTKLLIIICGIIIVSGLGFLFANSPIPESQVSINKESTQSGVLVTHVVDGDTIEISTGEKIRLLGVDTPETVDPRRPVGCFGKEASNKLKSLLEGKRVYLEKDFSETDKYDRLLRFVYLPLENNDRLFVNDYLIREGFAKVLTIPPDVKFTERFLQAQTEARENSRGLWGNC